MSKIALYSSHRKIGEYRKITSSEYINLYAAKKQSNFRIFPNNKFRGDAPWSQRIRKEIFYPYSINDTTTGAQNNTQEVFLNVNTRANQEIIQNNYNHYYYNYNRSLSGLLVIQ